MSYNLVNPTTGDLTRVAGGTLYADTPIGTFLIQYKKKPISGYLYCDGSTFDENAYPALYMYLGSNVLTDYRECVMVGAEENTTDTIATHDVYGEGEFKDDQLQEHKHVISTQDSGSYTGSYSIVGRSDSLGATTTDKETTSVIEVRSGETTHGKQKAVYVYIKATNVAVPVDFINAVDEIINENATSPISSNNKLATMDKVESKYSEENILTSTDWNTLNTRARYYFSGGNPMTNSPEEVPFGLLEVINVGPYCCIQRYFAFNGKLYIRRWSGNNWNEWYRFDGISI